MFATGDPAIISLTCTLFGVKLKWTAVTERDDSDASYRRAMEILINAGYVDAKIELTVQMKNRLGEIRAVYQCHGPCYELLETEATEHAKHNREWADSDGNIAGELIVTKRPIAVRLSSVSIDKFRLDRPNDKLATVPLLAEKLAQATAGGGYLFCEPEIVPLEIGNTAASGPDPDHVGVFYFRGNGYKLTKRNWQLLRAIWGHGEVEIEEVGELVWGNDLTPESTVRAQINRLNKQMGESGLNLAWRIDARKIVSE